MGYLGNISGFIQRSYSIYSRVAVLPVSFATARLHCFKYHPHGTTCQCPERTLNVPAVLKSEVRVQDSMCSRPKAVQSFPQRTAYIYIYIYVHIDEHLQDVVLNVHVNLDVDVDVCSYRFKRLTGPTTQRSSSQSPASRRQQGEECRGREA